MLWIVALINAFNMLDNMDGLSAGVAAIAAAILAAVTAHGARSGDRTAAAFCRRECCWFS